MIWLSYRVTRPNPSIQKKNPIVNWPSVSLGMLSGSDRFVCPRSSGLLILEISTEQSEQDIPPKETCKMRLLVFVSLLAAIIICGCDNNAEHLEWARRQAEASQQQAQNTQQHVQQAQQQALQAQQQADKVHDDIQHIQQLRDLDKMKYDTRISLATAESATWRAVLIGFSILLAVLLLWLAREIRMRRILSLILLAWKKRTEEQRE
jgi:hypothetical protein